MGMPWARTGYQLLRDEGPVVTARMTARFLRRRAMRPTLRFGSGRTCPVCGFSGRDFMPAGNPPRPAAMCPRCGARERHRLLSLYIERETDLTEGGHSVLYVAPAEQLMETLRHPGNDLTTIDLEMAGVDVRGDITNLPFADHSFDAIVCSHVLEHIPDDCAAMTELHRVLAREGEALIMVPKDKHRDRTYEDETITTPKARREAFGREDHVRWYGRDFPERLAESGFTVSVRTYADELADQTVERYGLRINDQLLGRTKLADIHHCRKPGE